jgi:hypothetical protein
MTFRPIRCRRIGVAKVECRALEQARCHVATARADPIDADRPPRYAADSPLAIAARLLAGRAK